MEMDEEAEPVLMGPERDSPDSSPLPPIPSSDPETPHNEIAMTETCQTIRYKETWFRSVLMGVVAEVQKHRQQKEDGSLDENEEFVLPNQLEEHMCEIWDSAMDEGMCRFLLGYKDIDFVDFLLTAIAVPKAPRLNEICFGIIANFCTFHEFCILLTQRKGFMQIIFTVMSELEVDTGTMSEAMRTIRMCLLTPSVRNQWSQAVSDSPWFPNLICYMLQSSTQDDLLYGTGQLLEELLADSDDLCEAWSCQEFVNAILVALEEIGSIIQKEKMKPFLAVFHFLSTTQNGVSALVQESKRVVKALLRFVEGVCDEDIVVLEDHVETFNRVIPVLNLMFISNPKVVDYLQKKVTALKNLMTVVESMYRTRNNECDNPATLPTCIVPEREEGSETGSQHLNTASLASEPMQDSAEENRFSEQDSSAGERGEEGLNNKQEQVDPRLLEWQAERARREIENEKYLRKFRANCTMLFESFQEYFQNFFDSLKLDDERGTSPRYQHVLQHLNKCCRRQISYLVSIMVYIVPPPVCDGGLSEPAVSLPGSSMFSQKGWESVYHLQGICAAFKLKTAVNHLEDVCKTVQLLGQLGQE